MKKNIDPDSVHDPIWPIIMFIFIFVGIAVFYFNEDNFITNSTKPIPFQEDFRLIGKLLFQKTEPESQPKKVGIPKDIKIVRLDDVSHGGASRLSVLVQTNPDFWEYHLIYIIDRINDYYKNEFDIIWITIIPDVIRPNSLDDSLKIINGSYYWLTIAQSLYVSPYKEKWNPGFNFIVHDESNGALISWERHSYYYEP